MKKQSKSITRTEFINMIGIQDYKDSFTTPIYNIGVVEIDPTNKDYYNITIIDTRLKHSESTFLKKDGDIGKIIKTKLFD